MQFDIVNFYPSIKEGTLLKALDFARKFTEISNDDVDIILLSCKTILLNGGATWAKKNCDGLFDIPMGSFHGAEVCELVGLFLLDKLQAILNVG